MNTTLDAQALFDEQELVVRADSPSRASVERTFCGLDGVLSIDMGARARRLRQAGVLRAASRAMLDARIAAVTAFIDGRTHTLRTTNGQTYPNLRMDTFRQVSERQSGLGLVLQYEIVYTQLGD
jgi:hypothetical protein